jgi:hypothetical protein
MLRIDLSGGRSNGKEKDIFSRTDHCEAARPKALLGHTLSGHRWQERHGNLLIYHPWFLANCESSGKLVSEVFPSMLASTRPELTPHRTGAVRCTALRHFVTRRSQVSAPNGVSSPAPAINFRKKAYITPFFAYNLNGLCGISSGASDPLVISLKEKQVLFLNNWHQKLAAIMYR